MVDPHLEVRSRRVITPMAGVTDDDADIIDTAPRDKAKRSLQIMPQC
jgi:hypothetical protein